MPEGAVKKDYRNKWPERPDCRIDFDPSPRRVRIEFAGETIVDTVDARLMRENSHTPVYYFPREDVRMDLLEATDHHSHCGYKGHCSYWSLRVGDAVSENAVWSYEDPYPEVSGIKDYLSFYWDRVDHWYEEDEEIFVHPRDPRKRVDAILSHRPVKVIVAGEEVASTTNARFLFETNHQTRYYIPAEDIRMDLLVPSSTRSSCPYKGNAEYLAARIGGKEIEDVAWRYPNPIAECPKIKGLIAFFDERVDEILVDGKPVPKAKTKWSRE